MSDEASFCPQANTSLLSPDCTKRCTCSASGVLTCQAAGCPEGRTCEVQAGSRDCWVPHGLCSLALGGKLTTFDGSRNAITSPDVYEVSSRCPGLRGLIPWYRVLADVRNCRDKLEAASLVHVFFQDGMVTMTLSKGVWVSGGGGFRVGEQGEHIFLLPPLPACFYLNTPSRSLYRTSGFIFV